MNLKERAKQLKTDIPAVYIALTDTRTPMLAKVIAGIMIGYALSPIDLIPDFIPVLGYLADHKSYLVIMNHGGCING